MDLLQALNWRYATKKMDPTKAVPEAKVQRILEAIRMTATSSGLQPYEIILVTNKEVRAKIQVAASNQAQITEGSHLLVFAAWNDYTASQRVIEASKEQVRANELALEGVEQEQQVGLRTTLDVLDAQQELLDSQLSVIRAERDSYVAAHGLLLSIGKLDAKSLSVNAPLYDPEDHRRAVRWTILSTRPADDR